MQTLTASLRFGQPSILVFGLHPALLYKERGPSPQRLLLIPIQVCRITLEQYVSVLTTHPRPHAFLEYTDNVLGLIGNQDD
jgi:hypothetical protein